MPLAHSIVRRLYGSVRCRATYDDLIAAAVVGLWKSLKGYDPQRSKFSTYATLRIRGYIQDWLRKTDFVPRQVRREMGVVPALKNLSVKQWQIHSDVIGRRDPTAPIELREEVAKVLAGCDEKERAFIHARFWEGLEYGQIAERHNVSKQWVFFVINRALRRMRENYA